LRLHPSIIDLRKKVKNDSKDTTYNVDLTYITSRGKWYHRSWKGDHDKSGGIATNIGVHFFDMLIWIFGDLISLEKTQQNGETASGILILEKARVNWFLSIDYNNVPEFAKKQGKRTFRSLNIEGEKIEFSDGFTELHTKSYKEILNGNGFGLNDCKKAIDIVSRIRKF
jgi:UDP-N-acetyl-2-amino-2-deoxyglucuronate dehydrogenase